VAASIVDDTRAGAPIALRIDLVTGGALLGRGA